MSYLYSATTGGFYLDPHPNPENAPDIPSDAVEITDEQYNALLDGQSNGQKIIADQNGYPMLEDYPPDDRTDDEIADQALNYAMANPVNYAMLQTLEEQSGDTDFQTKFKDKVKNKIKEDKEPKTVTTLPGILT